MQSIKAMLVCATLLVTGAGTTSTYAGHGNFFFAFLDGFQEVPSVLTEGAGFFSARLQRDGSIDFRLRVGNLSAPPAAAHIHFAQKGVNGGVMVTLCGGPPPAIVAACGEEISGTINPEVVGGLADSQGVAAGDFDGLLRALRSGNTYINVHTANFPGGEVRGQVK